MYILVIAAVAKGLFAGRPGTFDIKWAVDTGR